MGFFSKYKYWIGSGILLLGIGAYFLTRKSANGKGFGKSCLNPEKEDKALSDKFNFHLIPDGKCNYRSAQFTEEELPYVIKKYNIKRIVRLNGDGGDSKHRSSYPQTPIATEKAICEANGCTFTFYSSHHGYQEGKGYTKSIETATNNLKQGNTLIHCAHGADRTGGMVGAYLKNQGIMTLKDNIWKYTTQYNGWQSMIRKGTFFGSGYDKYADGFYPISELKVSQWAK